MRPALAFIVSSSFLTAISICSTSAQGQDVYSCGGFIKSSTPIAYDKVLVKLYTPEGNLKYETDCAPNNGYYMIPVYNKGSFVLRVHPPHGWKFEPESIELTVDGTTDACSQGRDLNFVFKGFPVSGQVVSGSRAKGPSAFQVHLKATDDTLLQSVNTVDGGSYKFEGVMPGTYKIVGGAQSMCAARTEAQVQVTDKAVKVDDDLVITGYALTGKVTEDGKPIGGVEFWLFSKDKREVTRCDTSSPDDLSRHRPSGHEYLCRTKSSDKTGRFEFACVPPGQYTVAAVYKSSNGVYFDLEPRLASLSIVNAPAEFTQTFQVTGFSVSGRVLAAPGGAPLPDVVVSVNGRRATTSNAEGVFVLTGVKAGQYQLQLAANHVHFEQHNIQLSAHAPHINDIYAQKFSVCGRVVFDNYPASLKRLQQRRVLVTAKQQGKGKSAAESLTTDNDGKFCKMLPPGAYDFEPQLTGDEKAAGVSLVPAVQTVKIVDRPVHDVEFRQFAATLSGQVQCLVPCKSVSVEAVSTESGHVIASVTLPSDSAQVVPFELARLLPGTYNVVVVSVGYCWEQSEQRVVVERTDVPSINFRQTGFSARLTSTHATHLNWRFAGSDVVTGELELVPGDNVFCVPVAGAYTLSVSSECDRFEPSTLTYDVLEGSGVQLAASQHRLSGTLNLPAVADELSVLVYRLSKEGSAPEQLPVKLQTVTKTETDAEGNTRTREIASSPPVYTFDYWSLPNERLQFVPKSPVYLFEPDDRVVDVKDACVLDVPALVGHKGLFLNGRIEPALANVQVTMKKSDDANIQYVAVSTDRGTYSIGPVRSFDGFELTAERAGYVFTQGERGLFRAYKLSELTIKVTDSEGEQLPAVLISISGGAANYRSNNLTADDGSITFVGLSPGEYFIRPVLKEYKFEPSTKIVQVDEGSTVRVELQATRFAYSCLGVVRHLGGQPVAGAVVEAVSEGCNQLQEEDRTDHNGLYRVRGLNPGCEYRLSVRADSDALVSGTYPGHYALQVASADVTNYDFVLRPVFTTMEVQGEVRASEEVLGSLRVELFAENDLDNRLQVINLAPSQRVFIIQDIPLDHKTYIVRLSSSLSQSDFSSFNLPEVSFVANESVRFFVMKFEPQRKNIDVEISKASYAAIPLAVVIALLVYNHAKVLPYVVEAAGSGSEWLSSTLQRHSGQAHAAANYSIPAEFDTPSSSGGQATSDGQARKRQRPRKT